MRCFSTLLVIVLGSLAPPPSLALDNGLARTPWMGWSAWEVFQATTPAQNANHSLSDRLVRETADALVDGGFAVAGYRIVWVDDAWMLPERDHVTGALVPDPARWPHGIKAAIDYVHAKGLLFGLYGDIGTRTCAGYPGLQRPDGSFDQDAQQLAEWGVDAFKVDGCNADVHEMDITYPALGRALNRTGRPMIYSCSWPDYLRSASVPINFTLLAQTCNTWRIFWDVQAGGYAHTDAERFDCVNGYLEFAASGSTRAAANFSSTCPGDWRPPRNEPGPVDHAAMIAAAGPGHFNDGDMLPIGCNYTMNDRTGQIVKLDAFSLTQARAAMALWAVLASPLMIGSDIRVMDDDSRGVWLNKGLIAANQDPLGKQGLRVRGNATACQVWRRELIGGTLLCVVLNNGGCNGTITVSWAELGLSSAATMQVVELIENRPLGDLVGSVTATGMDDGAAAAFRLSPATADRDVMYTAVS